MTDLLLQPYELLLQADALTEAMAIGEIAEADVRPLKVRRVRIAIDVERNPHLQEKPFGRPLRPQQLSLFERIYGFNQELRFWTRVSGSVKHLIVEAVRLISIKPQSAPLVMCMDGSVGVGTAVVPGNVGILAEDRGKLSVVQWSVVSGH